MTDPNVPKIRRVVTGHDDNGKAIVKIDEVCGHFREGRGNAYVCNIWTTDTAPANNSGEEDGGMRAGKFTMIENGSVFRILDFRPGVERRMHRTDSIDYLVVMQGEIDMELDDGVEVHLKQGDVMVQRGTDPKTFTDTAKVDKWFRRNCKDVLSRECSAAEKADVMAFLTHLKP